MDTIEDEEDKKEETLKKIEENKAEIEKIQKEILEKQKKEEEEKKQKEEEEKQREELEKQKKEEAKKKREEERQKREEKRKKKKQSEEEVKKTVKQYQKEHNITVDNKTGKSTIVLEEETAIKDYLPLPFILAIIFVIILISLGIRTLFCKSGKEVERRLRNELENKNMSNKEILEDDFVINI